MGKTGTNEAPDSPENRSTQSDPVRIAPGLKCLEEGARRVAAGDRGYRIRGAFPEEFRPAIEAFNTMAEMAERGCAELERLAARHHADLDERTRALTESEAWKGAILESALDAFVTMDGDGVITEFNPAAEKTFGYTREEAIGRQLADLIVPPSLRDSHREGLKRHMQTGISRILGRQMELPAMRSDGTEFPAEVAIVKVDPPGGKPFFTGYIRDLTIRKKAEESLRMSEEQLLHSQKMEAVGSLAGGVAHDFNNLLTAILGQSQLLLLKMDEGDPLRPRVEAIRAAGERGSQLTRQLLSFSRKETASAELIDMADVVHGIQDLLRRLIGEDMAMYLDIQEGPLPIEADRGQIEQILMNLCVNARDAMPDGGTLTVSARRSGPVSGLDSGPCIELSVSDTGTGMDEETRRRMFEPFFTTKEKGKGTGLGLSTVYGIVQQWKGRISAEESPGGGMLFRVRFPLSSAEAPAPAKAVCPFSHGARPGDPARAA